LPILICTVLHWPFVPVLLQAIERGCQFVILGSAPDPKVQAEFDELNNEMGHGQVSTCISHFSHTFLTSMAKIVLPSRVQGLGVLGLLPEPLKRQHGLDMGHGEVSTCLLDRELSEDGR
jgi:hypothetical protein